MQVNKKVINSGEGASSIAHYFCIMLNSALFLFSAKHNSQQQQNQTQKVMDLMVQEAKHVSDENISIIRVGVGGGGVSNYK